MGLLKRKGNIEKPAYSFVINDPNGTLLTCKAPELKAAGYTIKVFNLVDTMHSHAYNPFAYISEDKDIYRIIDIIMENTDKLPKEHGNLFWEVAETALLNAICCYLYAEAPYEEQNFSMVMELLRSADYVKGEDHETDLDLLFSQLNATKPEHIALVQYNIFKNPEEKTALTKNSLSIKEVLSTIETVRSAYKKKIAVESIYKRLEVFNQRNIGAMTITDNIQCDKIFLKKTALFIVLPDNYEIYHFIIRMLYTQLFDLFRSVVNNNFNGIPPLKVCFVNDFDGVQGSCSISRIIVELFDCLKKTDINISQHIKLINGLTFKSLNINDKTKSFSLKDINTPFDMLDNFFKEFSNDDKSVNSPVLDSSTTINSDEKTVSMPEIYDETSRNVRPEQLDTNEHKCTIIGTDQGNTCNQEKIKDMTHGASVIELYDKMGEKVKFEHLDTINFDGNRYVVITPLNEEDEATDEITSDVYIMHVTTTADGEEILEMIEDDKVVKKLYNEFKRKRKADYKFI